MPTPDYNNRDEWYTSPDTTSNSGVNGGTVLLKNPDIDTIRGGKGKKESPFAKYLPQYEWGAMPDGSTTYRGIKGAWYIDNKTRAITNAVTGKTYKYGDYNDYILNHPEDEEGITEEQRQQTLDTKEHIKQNPKMYAAGFYNDGGSFREDYFDLLGRPIYRIKRRG